jgi:hypothetical protein
MDVDKVREIARKGVPASLMKSEASHRTGPSPSMQDAKVVAPSRQRCVVFRPTRIWHPKLVAKAVERRKASVDDAKRRCSPRLGRGLWVG